MKKYILPIYLIVVAFVANAQTRLLFEETTPEAYLMKASAPESSSQQNINSLIGLLSNEDVRSSKGGRPSRKPEFVVRFEQQARISDAGEKLQLKVQLNKVAVSGDVSYKGFDLGDVLLPEKLNFKVQLLDAQDKEVKAYSKSVAMYGKSSFVILDETIPDTAASPKYKLRIIDKELVYSGENVRLVREQMEVVRAYYLADAALVKMLQDVALVLPDDIDRLPQQERNLRRIEDAFAVAKEAPFKKILNLRQNDPLKYVARLKEVELKLQERRGAINHALATLELQL